MKEIIVDAKMVAAWKKASILVPSARLTLRNVTSTTILSAKYLHSSSVATDLPASVTFARTVNRPLLKR